MNVQIAQGLEPKVVPHSAPADILKEERTTPEIYYTLLKYFARTTQFLAWPFVFIFFTTFFNLKINGKENLKNINSPFIVISNHVSSYDSFVFRLVLGLFTFKLPFRFMGVKRFDNFYLNILSALWIVDIVYALFGVFVVEPGRGIDKNLEEAQRIIKNGGNVVVYPEGSIVNSGKIEPFKLGAAVLAQKTGVPVLPISMRLGKAGFFDTDFVVNVGEKIEVDRSVGPEVVNERLYERVVELWGRV